jgi:uncharacterized Tic20 family protein
MNIADEIEKLDNLRQSGAISDEEYQKAKQSVLAKSQPAAARLGKTVGGISSDVNTWSMFIHLSQFCSYILPLAGLVVPIVLWQIKKNDSEIIDKHGRIVVNWLITEFIYGIVCALLCIVCIGIPLLLALVVVGIVFPIVGAIRASDGQIWPYPLSIRFFGLD